MMFQMIATVLTLAALAFGAACRSRTMREWREWLSGRREAMPRLRLMQSADLRRYARPREQRFRLFPRSA